VTLKLYGENLGHLGKFPLAVAYNGKFLKFGGAQAGPSVSALDSDPDESHGLVRLKLSLKPDTPATGKVELADVVLNGNTPGISYLVFLNPTFQDQDGNQVHAQANASRINVK
jgi:hypothetical protein